MLSTPLTLADPNYNTLSPIFDELDWHKYYRQSPNATSLQSAEGLAIFNLKLGSIFWSYLHE